MLFNLGGYRRKKQEQADQHQAQIKAIEDDIATLADWAANRSDNERFTFMVSTPTQQTLGFLASYYLGERETSVLSRIDVMQAMRAKHERMRGLRSGRIEPDPDRGDPAPWEL